MGSDITVLTAGRVFASSSEFVFRRLNQPPATLWRRASRSSTGQISGIDRVSPDLLKKPAFHQTEIRHPAIMIVMPHESTSDDQNEQQPAARRRWRKWMWIGSLCGIGLPIGWFAWTVLKSPVALEISRETTYLTEPLTEVGYVDFLSVFRARYEKMGGDSPERDEWNLLMEGEHGRGQYAGRSILYIDPVSAIVQSRLEADVDALQAESTDDPQDLIFSLRRLPWTAADHPIVADVVDRNSAWYERVRKNLPPIDAMGFPSAGGKDGALENVLLPGTQYSRRVTRRFLLRSCLRSGTGDSSGAFEDISFAYRITARPQLFLMEAITKWAAEQEASTAAAAILLSEPLITGSMIEFAQALPTESLLPQVAQLAHETRYIEIDHVQWIHRTREQNPGAAVTPKLRYVQPLLDKRFVNAIDWNRVLRSHNERYDRIDEGLQTHEWKTGFDAISDQFEKATADAAKKRLEEIGIWSLPPKTDDVIEASYDIYELIQIAWVNAAKTVVHRRAVQLAIRLAVWKQQHGHFPAELEELRSLRMFSSPPDNFFIDPFTSVPFIYRSAGTRFELRSVGRNMQEDAGGHDVFTGSQPHESPNDQDDIIFAWPPDTRDDREDR